MKAIRKQPRKQQRGISEHFRYHDAPALQDLPCTRAAHRSHVQVLHASVEVALPKAPVYAASPDHIAVSRVMENGADREQARLPRHLVGERIPEMPQEMVNDDDRKIVAEIYRSVV